MSSFTKPLLVSPVNNKEWVLLEEFDYHVGKYPSDVVITVPRGFVTNFASVPRFLWSWLPPWGKYGKATIIHDWLYRHIPEKRFTKKEADEIFYEAMLVLKVNKFTAKIMKFGVRFSPSWKKPKPGYLLSEEEMVSILMASKQKRSQFLT